MRVPRGEGTAEAEMKTRAPARECDTAICILPLFKTKRK